MQLDSNKENKYKYIWKSTIKYTRLFFLWAMHSGKRTLRDLVKLLESNILNCCLKLTMADLCKIGLKMRE